MAEGHAPAKAVAFESSPLLPTAARVGKGEPVWLDELKETLLLAYPVVRGRRWR